MKKVISLCIFALAIAAPLLAGDYRTLSFPTGYKVSALNLSGHVVGTANGKAFVWTRKRGFHFLGDLGGGGTQPLAINDNGAVVGYSHLLDGTTHAFLWTKNGGMQDLGSPMGGNSEAYKINAVGEVIGVSFDQGQFTAHAFFWSQASGTVDIAPLTGDPDSSASALNNNGEVVGSSYNPGIDANGFSWTQSGGISPLPSLGGPLSGPSEINDSGLIVGNSSGQGFAEHAALWTPDGNIQDLGVMQGYTYSYALDINKSGHVIGASYFVKHRDSFPQTFFWTADGGMIGIDAYDNQWAASLNNRDQILGQHSPSFGIPAFAYLWSPSLGVHKIANGNIHALSPLTDAGQFLTQSSKYAKLWTPVMHVSLSSSQNPAQAGEAVTFTADVSAIVGLPPDSEHVDFYDGRKKIGHGSLSNGIASFTTSSLTARTHYITAKYVGDVNYYPSKSPVLQEVVNP